VKVYATEDIRNVAVIGHGDCGKTSLVSALLHAAGAVNRLGKVEEGTATTDFDEEEIERKISLQTSLAHLEWKGKKINLVDTPGYAAFAADALGGLAVSDAALLLVDSVGGVEVITRRTFRYAANQELPVIFCISKMGRDRASFERTLAAIQDKFGREAVPAQIPIGEESSFSGVVDLISMKAHVYERDGDGKAKVAEIPAELAETAKEARAALVEMVAESDDSLMEAFFESGDLTAEQLRQGLALAVRDRKVFPVLCSSGVHAIGSQSMLDAIAGIVPQPGARGPLSGTGPDDETRIERAVDSAEPLSLFVFKTVADPYAGKLTLFRVCSGTLGENSSVTNMRTENSERIGHPSLIQGSQLSQIGEIRAGDLGVVAKLKETQTNDTLCDPSAKIKYDEIDYPAPVISYAVDPKAKGDEEKIMTSLQRLAEEDPVLKVARDPSSAELLVSGSGQVHVEVVLSKMKRKFGVDAILHPPKVPYLETIRKKVENVEGKHKKQSGGRGQFGVCVIHMEPLPRGSGFEFVDKIFGGSIPQNYRPAVQKGIRETADRGWMADCPVVDFRVTLVDGKYHNVDSSEMAFKIAGSVAFKAAMEKAAPTLLEPVMTVEITSPEEYMGDIMGDLSSRRGKPQGMEADGDQQIIHAQVPMSEMLNYASTLKSITSDRATYTMEFDHYAEAPSTVREKIIAEAKKAQAAES
jgi:elongation factor G